MYTPLPDSAIDGEVKKSLSERIGTHGLLHFNIAQTAILGAYIWLRGSNDAFSTEAFTIAAGIILAGWFVQCVVSLGRFFFKG